MEALIGSAIAFVVLSIVVVVATWPRSRYDHGGRWWRFK